MRWLDILQGSEHGFQSAGILFIPLLQHFPYRLALDILL